MSGFDYTRARDTAERLILKFGQSASVVIPGNASGYDTSGNVIAPTADTVINGIITPLLSYRKSEIDGESILHSDSYVYFHSDTAPSVGARVTINSSLFRVVSIRELTSVAGVNVYRKLQLRK